MTRPLHQPAASDFRQGSTDRGVIQTIEMLAHHGLITGWRRVIDATEKPAYTVEFPDGTKEDGLRPKEAQWLLAGMADALRSIRHLERAQKGA